MILIGSRALALRAPGLLQRKPVDFDFICTMDEYNTWMEKNSHKVKPTKMYSIEDKKMIVEGQVNCEFELIKSGNSCDMLDQLLKEDKQTLHTPFGMIPSFDLLFTIKSSHKYLKNNPYFWKTLADYHVMKLNGAETKPEHQAFLKQREAETYTYLHPKLNVSKKDFFSEEFGVKYTYDHDSIHQAVKLLDQPAYKFFQKEEAEVATSKEKFLSCSSEVQLYSVVEESAVLAIERSLVPHPGVLTKEQAWRMALSKVCTSIASGWWRAFAYENAFKILKLYPTDYWDKFQIGVANGVVKAL